MAEHPSEAVAMGDQMHAEMQDEAMRLVREHFADEGLVLDERRELVVGIGVGAGIAAAMQVLIRRGLLPTGKRA